MAGAPGEIVKSRLREVRKLRGYLKALSVAVGRHLIAVDAAMRGPSTPERGKQIAALCNALEMENDKVRYFALGVNWRKDRKRGSSHGHTA